MSNPNCSVKDVIAALETLSEKAHKERDEWARDMLAQAAERLMEYKHSLRRQTGRVYDLITAFNGAAIQYANGKMVIKHESIVDGGGIARWEEPNGDIHITPCGVNLDADGRIVKDATDQA